MSAQTIVVSGALANKPANGGEAWVRLSWIRGLQQLGCDVWFVEEIEERHCTDCHGRSASFAESTNLSWFRYVVGEFGLEDRAWLVCDSGDVVGPPIDRLAEVAADALLVNVSGHLRDENLLNRFGRRAFVDIDPGFTQIWHEQGAARLHNHDLYFTIGANIGRPGCSVPLAGRDWLHVRPPVVLDDWPRAALSPCPDAPWTPPRRSFSTVATWRGPFGPLEFDRRRFGLKVHEFRKYIELPQLVDARFEAALAIHPSEVADLHLLEQNSWQLVDPRWATGTTSAFRDYLAGSDAEFSVAQGVYVDTCSGWFSDRTTRYLALGRPALVQDTGFSRDLPVGSGLVAFGTLAEAVRGAESIVRDYDAHADAARDIAATYFGSDVVLSRFLEQCGCG